MGLGRGHHITSAGNCLDGHLLDGGMESRKAAHDAPDHLPQQGSRHHARPELPLRRRVPVLSLLRSIVPAEFAWVFSHDLCRSVHVFGRLPDATVDSVRAVYLEAQEIRRGPVDRLFYVDSVSWPPTLIQLATS